MRLIATRAILLGEEITTSYLATAQNGRRRRTYLKENYQFDCDCSLCQKEMSGSELDAREVLQCSELKCADGLVPMPSELFFAPIH